ncbi:MAG: rhomboid family intramembrane serine protease [Chloroflexi bacterium]|nr:rhomboid family intramembrane serine protease [Chloroflexota bacterium]
MPLGNASRRPLRFPTATVLIILVNGLLFIAELTAGLDFVQRWAVIPRDILAGRRWFTVLTAMFLHAGWAHILGNMLFFWVFGPQIENAMGTVRYVVFYLLGGWVATMAQVLTTPASPIPVVGASGAIAAVMGAFLIMFPRDRIRTVVFFGWFIRLTLMPAAVLIGMWFIIQLFSGLGALVQTQRGGVAYMAHIGGFVFGLLLSRFFRKRVRRVDWYLE